MRSRSLGASALVSVFCVLALHTAALGQWVFDPRVNRRIQGDIGLQQLPKLAPTPDGGCFIAWHEQVLPAPVNPLPQNSPVQSDFYWRVRMNKLDARGNPLWGVDGIVVDANKTPIVQSALQTLSPTVDYALMSDRDGNALLALTDCRAFPARDIFVYKVSPAGQLLWGDGVALSNNSNFEKDPRILQTPDGNFTVIWERTGTSTAVPTRGVLMQRLDSAGNRLLDPNGVLVAGSGVAGTGSNEVPDLAEMVPAEGNSVIIVYIRDTRSSSPTTSPRRVTAQKFNELASPLWNGGIPVTVSTQVLPGGIVSGTIQITPRPAIASDGAGGVVIGWHDFRAGVNQYNVFVQRLNASGALVFVDSQTSVPLTTGQGVSTNTTNLRRDVSVQFDPASASTYAFWREVNTSSGEIGLFGQRFDALGARLWNPEGQSLIPTAGSSIAFVRSLPPTTIADQASTRVFASGVVPGSSLQQIVGLSIDPLGTNTWAGAVTPICNAAGNKTLVAAENQSTVPLPVIALSDNSAVIAWEDDREGDNSLFAQRINPAGTLGNLLRGDFDNNQTVEVHDIFAFLAEWFARSPNADFDGSNVVDEQDIFDFLAAWFAR